MSKKIHPEVARHRARVAGYASQGDSEAAEQARGDLAWAKAQAAIEETVNSWPLPTPEQRDAILRCLVFDEGAG